MSVSGQIEEQPQIAGHTGTSIRAWGRRWLFAALVVLAGAAYFGTPLLLGTLVAVVLLQQ